MVESNLLGYISVVGKAIRELDPGSLVTIGFFSSDEPDAGRDATDNRWVLPAAVAHRSDVDFVDLHAYPGFGVMWDLIAPAFGLEERGADTNDEVVTANAGEADIGKALSPNTRPDACDGGTFVSANLALDRPATASAEEYAEFVARWVTDGSVGTWWSAADGPP